MGEYKGIDVSYHQGTINWKLVKESGIKFAIIRAGYGQSTMDKKFEENVKGCIEYGIPFGVYWFMYCTNEAEAILNAQKCNSVIEKYKDKITMKVWCDFEYDTETKANAKGVTFTNNTRTACINAFIKKMQAYGYEVGNYANPDYLKKITPPAVPLWLARYSSSKGNYNCLMWQYSSKGSVKGIIGNVDMNIGYFDSDPVTIKVMQDSNYYPKYTGTSGSIVAALKAVGEKDTSLANRKKIGVRNGIANVGTATANIQMLNVLKAGRLLKP